MAFSYISYIDTCIHAPPKQIELRNRYFESLNRKKRNGTNGEVNAYRISNASRINGAQIFKYLYNGIRFRTKMDVLNVLEYVFKSIYSPQIGVLSLTVRKHIYLASLQKQNQLSALHSSADRTPKP